MGNLSNILAKRLGMDESITVEELTDEQIQSKKEYELKVKNHSNAKPKKKTPEYNQLKSLWWKHASQMAQNVGTEIIVDDENEQFFKSILYYFSNDQENFAKHSSSICQGEPSIKKGLFIAGSYGFGKSLTMNAMRTALRGFEGLFAYKSTVEIVAEAYANSNEKNKQKIDYTKGTYCFDDLGQEKKYFGEELFADLLFQRYDLFRNKQKKTHITSNMSLNQIEERYGQYISSRFHEMFNVIYVSGKDRRMDKMKQFKTDLGQLIRIAPNILKRTFSIRTEGIRFKSITFTKQIFDQMMKNNADDWDNFLDEKTDQYFRV